MLLPWRNRVKRQIGLRRLQAVALLEGLDHLEEAVRSNLGDEENLHSTGMPVNQEAELMNNFVEVSGHNLESSQT
jgi:hypothetical protein